MKLIQPGDTVTVSFKTAKITLCDRAKVINIPHQTGESWIIEDLHTGQIHYISEGCTVSAVITAYD